MIKSTSSTQQSEFGEGIDGEHLSMPPFSVLMAVYYADKPEFFQESLSSVFSQTLQPNQVVLVCDGALPDTLDTVIAKYTAAYPDVLDVVHTPSPKNQGLGKALALGLTYCKHSLVARMDSDDISMPHRFERQITYMARHPQVDMLSSTIVEFADSTDRPTGYRSFATEHQALAKEARRRNPINHPAVVFRRERIMGVGGYIHFPLLEDYHLIARLLMDGGQLASLSEPLLYFRVTKDTYHRRRGLRYLRCELALQHYFRSIGFISWLRYLANVLVRIPIRILPAAGLERVYKRFFRSSKPSV